MHSPNGFDWEDENAAAHFAKHGVAFDVAIGVFSDAARMTSPDLRFAYGEDRFNTVGTVDGIILNVTYTMLDNIARIISARRASTKERKRYGQN